MLKNNRASEILMMGAVAVSAVTVFTGTAIAGETLLEALKEGKPYLDMRYRYEFVDQDGLSKDAHASTLRTRAGVETGKFYDVKAVLEVENVVGIGKDSYNDTVNGKTNYPTVADIENTEINQAYFEYSGLPETAMKVGRQAVILDNQRFIGDVGWRQNNQTFDAVTLTNKSIPDTTVKYGYINNVNRIFGDRPAAGDWDSNTHYYNIANTSTPLGTITTYGYFLDFQNESPGNSSRTFGASIDGKRKLNDDFTVKYYGEYAYQEDQADNTTDYNANYYHIAPALVWKGLTGTIGYEVLGSDDGAKGFATPLATLHKFNGWADKFLTTPAAGLEDFYVDLTCKVSGLTDKLAVFNGLLAKVQYHEFNADDGGAHYGNEWGIYLKKPVTDHYYVEVKYADYDADDMFTDTQKLTFGVGIKY